MACTHLVGSKSCERATAGSICACCIVLPVQPGFIFFPPFLPRCGVGALPRSAMQPFHAGSLWDDVCDSDGPELSSAHADGHLPHTIVKIREGACLGGAIPRAFLIGPGGFPGIARGIFGVSGVFRAGFPMVRRPTPRDWIWFPFYRNTSSSLSLHFSFLSVLFFSPFQHYGLIYKSELSGHGMLSTLEMGKSKLCIS